MQVLGGYGYTRDYPLERLDRDNRLNHIHEGTFGIQGMDLVGRKILSDGGAELGRLLTLIRAEMAQARDPALAADVEGLAATLEALERAVAALTGCADPARRVANATLFLDAFGHAVIGWIWLWQARLAQAALAKGGLSDSEARFYTGKRQACRYFTVHELPLARARLDICARLDAPSLDSDPALFMP